MATFGPIASSAPNVLFDPMKVDTAIQGQQRNALLMQQSQQAMALQQRQTAALGGLLQNASPADRAAFSLMEPSAIGTALVTRNTADAEDARLRSMFSGGVTPASMPMPAPASRPAAGGGYLDTLGAEENSTGNPAARNPRSTATGNFQFIDGTWREYAAANPDRFQGMSPEQILARRSDPAESRRAAEWYAQNNGRALSVAGLPNGPAELAMGHRFGPQGAVALLRAPDDATAASVLGEGVIRANPSLANVRVGQLRGEFTRRYGGTQAPSPAGQGGDVQLVAGNDMDRPLAGGGGQQPSGGQDASPADLQRATQLRQQGEQLMLDRNPRVQAVGRSYVSQADVLEKRVEADRTRRATPVQTLELGEGAPQGPGVYERTPEGGLRRLSGPRRAPPSSEGEGFAGNGLQSSAANILLNLGDKVEAGTASAAEVQRFRMAVDIYQKDTVDPATQQKIAGLPLTPETRRALDALNGRTTGGSTLPGDASNAGGSMSQPPRIETSDSGSTRVVQAGQTTPQAREAARKMQVEAGRVQDAINAFREALKANGGGSFNAYANNPRDPRATRLNTAFSNLTTALRSEAFINTGVLQPGETKMLNDMLLSPQSARGWMASSEGYEGMLGEIEGFVNNGVARARDSALLPDQDIGVNPRQQRNGGLAERARDRETARQSGASNGAPAPPPGFQIVP